MKKLIGMIAALAMITGSAYAADWNFYGSARVATFFTDLDSTDTTSFSQALQGNSRIGATVKVSDAVTGGFEYGTGVNVRKLYGEWNFGAGSLLVGQTYTPMNLFYSNQVYGSDNDLLAQGGVYSGRKAMLRLKFGGFQIAAVAPQASAVGGGTTETDLPGIEAKYSLKMNNFGLDFFGGYNTFEETIAGVEYDIDTWVLGAGAKADFGAFYMNGSVYFGENAGHMIAISVDGDNTWGDGKAAFNAVTNQLLDNDCMGLLLVAGVKINDMFTIEAGYGYAETDLDGTASDDEVASYYIQSVITLAPGVYVIPEIGKFDGEENGDEETTYYGAKWQINF